MLVRFQNSIFQDFSANFLIRMKHSAIAYQPLRMTKMAGGKNFGRPKLGKVGWVVRRLCTVSEKLNYCKLNDLYIILIRI